MLRATSTAPPRTAGPYSAGTVFELVNSAGTYNETVLHSFAYSGGDGASPISQV